MKFRFKLTFLTILLLVAVTLLCGYGIVLNVITLSEKTIETLTVVLNVILIVLNLFLLFVVFSVFAFGKYSIEEKGVILKLGIFKVLYPKEELHSIKLFSKTQKLVLFFVDGKYTVIVINPEKYLAFSKAVQNKFHYVYEEVLDE